MKKEPIVRMSGVSIIAIPLDSESDLARLSIEGVFARNQLPGQRIQSMFAITPHAVVQHGHAGDFVFIARARIKKAERR